MTAHLANGSPSTDGPRATPFLTIPTLLSLSRGGLAFVFPWTVHSPFAALAVLGVAGLTDVLDGFLARRWNQVTAAGALVDGIVDKIFVLSVAISLAAASQLHVWEIFALATRDVLEVIIAVVFWMRHRHFPHGEQRANRWGKLATVVQFGAVGCALFALGQGPYLAALAAGLGTVAAFTYARRLRAEFYAPD
jgi:cardiolipin synthase